MTFLTGGNMRRPVVQGPTEKGGRPTSPAANDALKRLRESLRGTVPDGVSVVEELIAERRSEQTDPGRA
jgi:hypothetical protein